MKKFLLMLISLYFLPSSAYASPPEGCPMSSAEELVCEVVLCNPIGLAIAESRSECLEVNRRFTIYLATLGFWSKPPKCKMRDKNCNKVGKASNAEIDPSYCDDLDNEDEKNSCKAALGIVTQEYCDTFSGDEKEACEAQLPKPTD